MAKRRTRKDKENVHHTFTVSWNPEASQPPVNSQKNMIVNPDLTQSAGVKNSYSTALSLDLATIRRGIMKSVIVSAFIIAFELVIYFFL